MEHEHKEFILTPAEAEAFVRKARGKTLFIACGQSAPCADKPGYVFPLRGNIKVTRKAAIKFICEVYSATMQNKGALCVIHTLADCVFIGRAA